MAYSKPLRLHSNFKVLKIPLGFSLIVILFSLFAASGHALGVWDSEGPIQVFESYKVLIGTSVLRVTKIEDNTVFFDVEKFGEVIGSGYVSAERTAYTLDKEIRVEYQRPSDVYSYGRGAYIKPYAWVDGKIANHNIPSRMHLLGLYNIFVNVQNTGSKPAKFRVELTQAGEYNPRNLMYKLPSGEESAKILNIDFPFQLVEVPFNSVKTVYYKNIQPKIDPGRHELSTYRSADMVLKLYYGETLIEELNVGRLVIDTGRSGYIKSINAPQVMSRDMEYYIDVEVANTGYTTQGVSKTFNLELLSPEFRMTPIIKRDDIPSFSSKPWSVMLLPLKTGEFDLKFRLSYYKGFSITDKIMLHELSIPVRIIEGYSSYIEQVNVPGDIKLGDEFKVGVNLHNYGNERRLVLKLKAPALLDAPQEKLIRLSPTSTYQATFTLKAAKAGNRIPLTLELLPHQDVLVAGKNYDPNPSESYIINTKTVYIDIDTTTVEQEKEVKEEKPEVVVKFIEPPVPKVIEAFEIGKEVVEPVRVNLITALLLVIAIVLGLTLFKVMLSLRKKR